MISDVEFLEIEEKEEYKNTIDKVLQECFKEEKLERTNLYVSILLTNPNHIREINREYRKMDKATDVLSFPMFEKEELQNIIQKETIVGEDVLGDIVISIPKVEEQADEYEHSFTREFAYMIVHGFYHLMGYDHMEEAEKKQMRQKEETILERLQILQ